MGLDMYLRGQKYLWHDWEHPENDRKEDGLRISQVEIDLGYWRKHPNLHGFIVQAFAGGKDECQDIELSDVDMRNIISAIQGERLPHTEGFFFGASELTPEQRASDLLIFERALAWLAAEPKGEKPSLGIEEPIGGGLALRKVKVPKVMPRESRSVIYRASW